MTFPTCGEVWRKGKLVRKVMKREGYLVVYEANGKTKECWITTWNEWIRGAELISGDGGRV